jgi:hypothetical protein
MHFYPIQIKFITILSMIDYRINTIKKNCPMLVASLAFMLSSCRADGKLSECYEQRWELPDSTDVLYVRESKDPVNLKVTAIDSIQKPERDVAGDAICEPSTRSFPNKDLRTKALEELKKNRIGKQ